MKVEAEFHQSRDLMTFLQKMESPQIRQAAVIGLNEHATEQRRLSTRGIAAYTGVPLGRVSSVTKLIKASASAQTAEAKIRTTDRAIMLSEYGQPVWVRDLNPFADGKRGGPVSSMKGAEATGWNVRRQFKGAFIANGQVVVRKSKDKNDLKTLSMAVLANELAKPTRPNVDASERYAAVDLERRVIRQVIRFLG